MGIQQSKEELLYRQVGYGNTDGIKELRRKGAGLEWVDREGKTPLIVACMNPKLLNVVKTLIELGANLNAYRPGSHGGTPLHHAAKKGLEDTVKLLLSYGANALVINDDCQTPLALARAKGFSNVVRAIESHVCLFSGWLREFHGPGFLSVLAPQLVSRNVWVVVLPYGAPASRKPLKLELAIYSKLQDAKPHTVVALWKAVMEVPNFDRPDPMILIIVDHSEIPRNKRRKRHLYTYHEARHKGRSIKQTRVKLAPPNESEKHQLQLFCNACKGTLQGSSTSFSDSTSNTAVPPTAPPAADDMEFSMAINASLQSTINDRPPSSETNVSTSRNNSSHTRHAQIQNTNLTVIQTSSKLPSPVSIPSAPPLGDAVAGEGEGDTVHYPSSFSSPVSWADRNNGVGGLLCVICLDAPVEGACIPCGHMAGCMACLNEIKAKSWGCPVCRSTIDQLVRLYVV